METRRKRLRGRCSVRSRDHDVHDMYMYWTVESMAVELVQSALISVLSRPECQVQTERSRLVRETSERVTAAISKAENKSQFDSFAEKLVDLLSRPVSDAVKLSCSQSAKRERMWKAFHRARSTTVEALWKTFLSNVHIGLFQLIKIHPHGRTLSRFPP